MTKRLNPNILQNLEKSANNIRSKKIRFLEKKNSLRRKGHHNLKAISQNSLSVEFSNYHLIANDNSGAKMERISEISKGRMRQRP